MTHSVVSIDHLKQQVLPELFTFPARLGEYGGVADSSAKIDQLSDLMESGSAAALAAKIAEILSKMADASPEQITRARVPWPRQATGSATASGHFSWLGCLGSLPRAMNRSRKLSFAEFVALASFLHRCGSYCEQRSNPSLAWVFFPLNSLEPPLF